MPFFFFLPPPTQAGLSLSLHPPPCGPPRAQTSQEGSEVALSLCPQHPFLGGVDKSEEGDDRLQCQDLQGRLCGGLWEDSASLWVLVLPTLTRGLGLGEILSVEVAGDG